MLYTRICLITCHIYHRLKQVFFPYPLGSPLTVFVQVDQQVVEGNTLVAVLQGATVLGMASNPTSTPHKGTAYCGQGQHLRCCQHNMLTVACGKGHDRIFMQKAADAVKS